MGYREFSLKRGALAGCDLVEASSAQTFARHFHEQFGIGIITAGAQSSFSGRGFVEAFEGDVISVSAGEVHDGSPIGNGARTWTMIYLDPQLVSDTFADCPKGDGDSFEFRSPVFRSEVLRRLVNYMIAAARRGAEVEFEQALLLTLQQSCARSARQSSPHVERIARALDLVNADPARALTLKELAHACGISRYQLIRAFARKLGLTPHGYIVQRRLELVRKAIRGGVPLAQAAAIGGFADQSHMTRSFRERFGLSPGAYASAFAPDPQFSSRLS